jgi:hypothetical protein
LAKVLVFSSFSTLRRTDYTLSMHSHIHNFTLRPGFLEVNSTTVRSDGRRARCCKDAHPSWRLAKLGDFWAGRVPGVQVRQPLAIRERVGWREGSRERR